MTTIRSHLSCRPRGFTLIEVMVVVAIIGILASIAYPSYTESVAKGRRSQATAQLMAAQQWMERFFTENLSYAATTGGVDVTAANQFPARFNTVPPAGEGAAVYNLELLPAPALTANSYTLRATRAGSMANDRCGSMLLDHLGRKSVINYSGFADAAAARTYCWR